MRPYAWSALTFGCHSCRTSIGEAQARGRGLRRRWLVAAAHAARPGALRYHRDRVRAPTLLLVAVAVPALVAAQAGDLEVPPGAAPETRWFIHSDYERDTIDAALASLALEREPQPEGKPVEAIDTARLDVIEERDPAPRFVNVFHAVTRSYVIDREVLLRPGEPYRNALAHETQRRLAALPQLSLVLVVPVKGHAPGSVRILVITKDVWSLRSNWDMSLTSGGLESLTVKPSEMNLLGTHQQVGLEFTLLPESWSIGGSYAIPRLLADHVAASAHGGVIVDRRSGDREGSYGSVQVGLPLWSSLSKWSWSAGASWSNGVSRRYRSARLASFVLDPATQCDGPAPPLCVPYAYLTDVVNGGASVTRSFGWSVKHDVSAGFDVSLRRYRLPDLSAYDPATVEAFATRRVPASDDRVGPWVQVRRYTTDFLRVLDLETLALQEDYGLGLDLYLRIYASARALGGTRDLVGVSAGAGYTAALGDGLVRGGVESIDEFDTGLGAVSDGSIETTLRLASPRWVLGRLVLDAVLLNRYRNGLRLSSYLGGDGRLRGFPTSYLVGSSILAANLEYRSLPLQLFRSVQLGGVVFFDAGNAFDSWKSLDVLYSAGAGLRVLFPQLDRVVFRIDVGFPLSRPLPRGVAPVNFFVTFGQAFPPYGIAPRTADTL